jgi:CCR4-NOT transcription complex subunit 2
MRQKNGAFRQDSVASQSSLLGQGPPSDNRNPHGAIGNDSSNGKGKESKDNGVPDMQDHLAGISPADRFGLKGLRHMMSAHPDFQSFLAGVDPTALGIDLNSNEYVPLLNLL